MSRSGQTVVNALANCSRFAANMLVLFLITPLIIQSVGTEDFGLWSLVFATLGFLGLLDLGLQTATVRYVAECRGSGDRERRNALLSTLAATYVAIGLVSALLLGLIVATFNVWLDVPPDQHSKATALLWILGVRVAVLGLPLSLFRGILFAEQMIVSVSTVQAVTAIVYGSLCWAALHAGGGLVTLAWANLFVMIAEGLAMMTLAYRLVPGLRLSRRLVRWPLFREVAAFSGTQVLVNASMVIRLRSDPLIVKIALPMTAVGVYAVAGKAAEYLHLLVKQAVNVLAPVAGELHGGGDSEGLRRLYLQSAKYAVAPAVAGAVACYPLAGDALVAWVGPEFRSAGIVLAVLMTATALSMVETSASSLLAMTGYHRPAARAAGLSAIVNVVLSLLLVTPLGLLGVALGTLGATLFVDAWIVPRIACRAYGVPAREYVLRVLVPLAMPAMGQLIVTLLARSLMSPTTVPGVVAAASPGFFVFSIVFFRWSLSAEERGQWSRLLQRFTGRLRRPKRARAT